MNSNDTRHRYDDIINLPHHVSPKHPQMSMRNRAAQFSPFAALTGHDEAIAEAGRLTEAKVELDEDTMSILDAKLHEIRENIKAMPEITVTWFTADGKKEGGHYSSVAAHVKKIDDDRRRLIMTDGLEISIEDIRWIEL